MTTTDVAKGIPKYAYYALYILAVCVGLSLLITLLVRSVDEYKNPLTGTGSVKRTRYPMPMIFMCNGDTYSLVDISTPLYQYVPNADELRIPKMCQFVNGSETSSPTNFTCHVKQGSLGSVYGGRNDSCFFFNFETSDTLTVGQTGDFLQILIGVKDQNSLAQAVNVYFVNNTIVDTGGLNSSFNPTHSFTLAPFDKMSQMFLSTSVAVPLQGNYFTATSSPIAKEPPFLDASYWTYSVSNIAVDVGPQFVALKPVLSSLNISDYFVVLVITVQDYFLHVNTEYTSIGPISVLSAVGGIIPILLFPVSIFFVEERLIFLQFCCRGKVRSCDTQPDGYEPPDKEMFDVGRGRGNTAMSVPMSSMDKNADKDKEKEVDAESDSKHLT